MRRQAHPGVIAALLAAGLFGASTPLSKLLLEHTSPWLLASLLYLGSGVGLFLLRQIRGAAPVSLAPGERRWLAGAIACGGILAPVLLMTGLASMPASSAALLLNAEGVFTALLAWFAFQENFDRRIALGMVAIVAGAVVLSWPAQGQLQLSTLWPSLAVLGACFAWGLDNNLTRKVSLTDASWVAMTKGLAAGLTNLALAVGTGAAWPGTPSILGAALVGFLSYGASLTLFVVALRNLGTARTGAYFSIAPFFGAVLAIALLDEPLTRALLAGGALMAVGLVLHLTEHHEHEHTHEEVEHEHEHVHDESDLNHHDHQHDPPVPPGTRHTHRHVHARLTHTHAHYPDIHHQHEH